MPLIIGTIRRICKAFACSTDAVQPSPHENLVRAVTQKNIAYVIASLNELDTHDRLSNETSLFFRDVFFTPPSRDSEDDFIAKTQEKLIDFLLKRQSSNKEPFVCEGRSLSEILTNADSRNQTQLVAMLNRQLDASYDETSLPSRQTSQINLFQPPIHSTDCDAPTNGWKAMPISLSATASPSQSIEFEASTPAYLDLSMVNNTSSNSVNESTSQRELQATLSKQIADTFSSLPTVVKNFRLLLVDDSMGVAKTFLQRFKDSNIDIYYVNTPEQALKAMQGKAFLATGYRRASLNEKSMAYTSKHLLHCQKVEFDVVLQDFDLGSKKKSGPELVAEYRVFEHAKNFAENSSRRLPILTFSTNVNTTNLPVPEEHRPHFDGTVEKPGPSLQTFQALHAILGDEYIAWSEATSNEPVTSY